MSSCGRSLVRGELSSVCVEALIACIPATGHWPLAVETCALPRAIGRPLNVWISVPSIG